MPSHVSLIEFKEVPIPNGSNENYTHHKMFRILEICGAYYPQIEIGDDSWWDIGEYGELKEAQYRIMTFARKPDLMFDRISGHYKRLLL